MAKVYSKALDQSVTVDRLIGHIKGSQPGPTLIFTSGIHGNEPSGVFALIDVFKNLRDKKIPVKGNIYAISGNLWALERGERFHSQDLNRLWTSDRVENGFYKEQHSDNKDVAEQVDIYNTIKNILDTESGPFYFIDLHTTSCESIPFVVLNDSMLNRKFSIQYPIPMILGIEEYLEGPLLSYINTLGYVALGYESGQHDDIGSIQNHVAFIYLTLVLAESVDINNINYYHYYEILAKTSVSVGSYDIHEIFYRYKINETDSFSMKPGFVNFQHVMKGQELAKSNGNKVFAPKKGRIFMPLYQSEGDDGFFVIRKIPTIFHRLSAVLRKIRFDHVLPLLPGVHWVSDKHDALMVNRTIARFFTKQFFHLLGYRSKRIDKNHLVMVNREAVTRNNDYGDTKWC